MSQSHKRRPYMPPQRLSDPALPLNIALAYLLVRVFPQNAHKPTAKVYSDGFVTAILALVSQEVFEIGDSPASFEQLRLAVEALIKPEVERIRRFNDKMRDRGQEVDEEREAAETDQSWLSDFAASFQDVPEGSAFLDNLEKEVRERINEDDEEEMTEFPEPIERRSPLGLFLRGVLLTLRKMSFTETANVSRQIGTWCGVRPGPSTFAGSRKHAMEDTLATRSTAMDQMTEAMGSGDYASSLESLRRFYDYQFPQAGRGKHQHALLNLASFHYSTGGMVSAREAVNEAIRVARAEGDRLCLSQCISLSHRIEGKSAGSSTTGSMNISQNPITEPLIPQASTPMDELWSIKAALDLGEPVHVAQRRVYKALGRSLSSRIKQDDKQMQGWTTEHPFDEGAWHAAQSGLWTIMGSSTLAEIHDDLALECEDVRGDARLAVLLSRAERLASQGDHDAALSMLLDVDHLDGLNLDSYERWAACVWAILRHRIELSGDLVSLDLITALKGSRPGERTATVQSPSQPKGTIPETVRSNLRKASKMTEAGQPAHIILPEVLSAMTLSSELGLWPLYRLSVVTFAEVTLGMEGQGMARKSIEEVEKIWPELVTSRDEETITRAAIVLGKAMISIALDEHQPDLFDHAVHHLERALTSARRVGATTLILSITTLLSLVAEMQDDTNRASRVESEWEKAREEGTICAGRLRDHVRQVGEIVKYAGVRVSERWE